MFLHMQPENVTRSSRLNPGVALVTAIATLVFWRTAYPSITWWDSSSYSLAAGTLGINGPPGSLLLTLLGWPLARLPFSTPAYVLNLFAGLLAGLTAALVYVTARRLLRIAGAKSGGADLSGATALGAALGALTFAFSDTLWEHAVKFTPYVLTALFTGLILWTMMRWWEGADRPDSWRRLALLGLLFGLDFSVHRTNALLIPGALVWILIRDPAVIRRRVSWVWGVGSFVAGLAVNLLLIPIAAFTRSPFNWWEPSNWPRYWDYVSLKTFGGGFLLDLFPRKSHIWSVQAADLLRILRDNFFPRTGSMGVLGVLPALAAVLGLAMLWRNNRRLAAAFLIALLLQASLTVLYFNIPAQFFRPFDRHYLPVCVTIAVLVAFGLATLTRGVANLLKTRARVGAVCVAALVVAVPAGQLAGNWTALDASNRYFTLDYAANVLRNLPADAIYFTVGDNDTFPPMYLQAIEGVRPDVTIINLSVASLPDFTAQLKRRDPSFPLSMPADVRARWNARVNTDTAVVIHVRGDAVQTGLGTGVAAPDSVIVRLRPFYGARMQYADIAVLDIVSTDQWRRPITFAITAASGMGWLEPFARPDGLFWRVVPVRAPQPNAAILHSNLIENSVYRGYADSSVRMDEVSRGMGFSYYTAFRALLQAEQAGGDSGRCRIDATALFAEVPAARLRAPAGLQQQYAAVCSQAAPAAAR